MTMLAVRLLLGGMFAIAALAKLTDRVLVAAMDRQAALEASAGPGSPCCW
jgi:hypothetical protein